MRMKTKDKILLVLGGVLLFCVAALMIGMGLGIIQFSFSTPEEGGFFEHLDAKHYALACIGLLGVVFAVYLISIPGRLRYSKNNFVIQKIENGELRIKIEAIENLIKKCVDTHEEMQLLDMRVDSAGGSVLIDMDISLSNNVSIPLAVASLQKQVKQYLMASSGIDVGHIGVTVQTTSGKEAKMDSPYMVSAETEQEETSEKKEKTPIYQRLFGEEDERKEHVDTQHEHEEEKKEAPPENNGEVQTDTHLENESNEENHHVDVSNQEGESL